MTRILALVLAALMVAGCGGPATPTPDTVATEVAQALAVAGTLTALAPTATATALPTATLAPTPAPTATLKPTRPPTAAPTATRTHTPMPLATSTPEPEAVVQSETLNIRSGPGTNYEVVGKARRGDRLPIFGQVADCAWLKVVVAATAEEWVAGGRDFVTINQPCASIGVAWAPPSPTPQPRRLATGRFIRDSGRYGYGRLTVSNGRDLDAVVVLATLTDAPVLSFYVRGGDSFTATDINDGTYHLFFTLGEDWDSAQGRFTMRPAYLRFEDSLVFRTTSIQGGVEYSTFSVTLHGVAGGTAATLPVDAGQFPGSK